MTLHPVFKYSHVVYGVGFGPGPARQGRCIISSIPRNKSLILKNTTTKLCASSFWIQRKKSCHYLQMIWYCIDKILKNLSQTIRIYKIQWSCWAQSQYIPGPEDSLWCPVQFCILSPCPYFLVQWCKKDLGYGWQCSEKNLHREVRHCTHVAMTRL